MKDLKNYPTLPGSDKNAPEVVPAEQISTVGVNTGAYAVREGDIFTFDADEAVVKQKLPNSENVAYYITCTRNGKHSFISASQLMRRAYINGKFDFVGPLQRTLGEMPSLKERLEYIVGKTFKGSKPIEVEVTKFVNGVRTEEKQKINISILEQQ